MVALNKFILHKCHHLSTIQILSFTLKLEECVHTTDYQII